MNKKGFTLVELLMVIALLALISAIAIPNISNILESTKKEHMLDDAKKLISLAEAEVRKSYEIRNSGNHTFYINDLNFYGEILGDPDGGEYASSSYVKYDNTKGQAKYCISLIGSKRNIGKINCVDSNELYSINNVVNNN